MKFMFREHQMIYDDLKRIGIEDEEILPFCKKWDDEEEADE